MKWSISRIRLNRQGYARGGRYFGLGGPLFEANTNEWTEGFYETCRHLALIPRLKGQATNLSAHGFIIFRAANRTSAKGLILGIDPSAKFPRAVV